jgi:hypothetical protein
VPILSISNLLQCRISIEVPAFRLQNGIGLSKSARLCTIFSTSKDHFASDAKTTCGYLPVITPVECDLSYEQPHSSVWQCAHLLLVQVCAGVSWKHPAHREVERSSSTSAHNREDDEPRGITVDPGRPAAVSVLLRCRRVSCVFPVIASIASLRPDCHTAMQYGFPSRDFYFHPCCLLFHNKEERV